MSKKPDVHSKDENTRRPKRRKPRSELYKGNNEGGFCNPPVRTQFGMGNKGGGRPRGSTLESALRKALAKRIAVNRDGERMSMAVADAYAERILEALFKGPASPRMLEFGIRLLQTYGRQDNVAEEAKSGLTNIKALSLAESTLLLALMNKGMGEPAPQDRESPLGPQYARRLAGTYEVTRGADGMVAIRNTDWLVHD
ncbi:MULTISPECIES: DUF5681 domain-containing protein [Sphingomonas]|uniref:DUF5681 domain-containing protein n=1 Tax=Sphingomonas TaxID=13687 RepID=UPI001269AC1B|nr:MULTISPECIES: DUF5681 domain-containing protein [Sphingomonas]